MEKEQRIKTVTDFALREGDTGSVEVQVALLTGRVKQLMEHLKVNTLDHHSRRGLLQIIGQRKRLLSYLSRKDTRRYASLVSRLGLRK